MECKWKINIVPCDKANKLIKVFSFLLPCWCLCEKSAKELFFLAPLLSFPLSICVRFCFAGSGINISAHLGCMSACFSGKKSLKGIFFNRNNGNTDVKHGGKIIVFIGVALSLACTNLWTCMHTALRPRNVAQCFEFVLLQHRKQGETRFWFLKAWRVWWNCWTSPLCVCVCVSVYICVPVPSGPLEDGLEEEEEECVSEENELLAKDEFSVEENFTAEFETENISCEDMEYFCNKGERPALGQNRNFTGGLPHAAFSHLFLFLNA